MGCRVMLQKLFLSCPDVHYHAAQQESSCDSSIIHSEMGVEITRSTERLSFPPSQLKEKLRPAMGRLNQNTLSSPPPSLPLCTPKISVIWLPHSIDFFIIKSMHCKRNTGGVLYWIAIEHKYLLLFL